MVLMNKKRNCLGIFSGIVVMLVLTVASVLLIPICILNEYLSLEYTQSLIVISIGIFSFLGTYITGCLSADRGGVRMFFPCVVYFLLIASVTIFCFDGLSQHTACSAFSSAVGCFIAYRLLNKSKKPRAKRNKSYANG